MKITKTTSRTYNVKFFPGSWNITQRDFIESRKNHGMSTKKFEKCFCCGKTLPLDEVPTVVHVEGVGNRFACKACKEQEARA